MDETEKWMRGEFREIILYIFIGLLLFIILPIVGGFFLRGFQPEILGGQPFAISIGSLGTAIALVYAASTACHPIARKPETYTLILRTSLLAQAIIESAAIYALIVALILMTKQLV